MKITQTNGPTRTFTEKSDISLDGCEGKLVKLHTDGTVMLAAATTDAIGVYEGKLAPGSKYVVIRLLNAPGTAIVKQAAAIAVGSLVMQDSSAKNTIAAYSSGAARVIGTKIAPATNGAAGDLVEIMLSIETKTA